jgi:hypothetical protein
MGELLEIAVSVLALGALALAYLQFRLHLVRTRLVSQVRSRYSDFEQKVSSVKDRFGVIRAYASDYMNSMSPGGVQAMYELHQLITTQTRLADELKQLVESGETASLTKAGRILSELVYSLDDSAPLGASGVVRSNLNRWELRCDSLLQAAGSEIAIASRRCRELGFSRRRDRKPTEASLKKAGILAADDHSED